MLATVNSTPNFHVSPTHHITHKQKSFTYHSAFKFIKPHPTISTPYSSRVSASLTQPIHPPVQIRDYNAQIYKFCELGNLQTAMEILCTSPDPAIESRTYCSILQLCADARSLEDGKKVHSIICSRGIEIQGVLGSKLVFMYVTCGDLREGRRIFDKIGNEKVFLWNLMMNEYAKIRNFRESICLFKRMWEFGIEANSHSLSCAFKCFAALGSVMEGEGTHGYLLKLGLGCHNLVVNSLIAFYFKSGRVESAHKLFEKLTDRDVISWNSMISGYIANGMAKDGLHIFEQMLSVGVEWDLATMICVLTACANNCALSLGQAIHASAIKASFNKEITFNNTLLHMYSRCGDLNGSIKVFDNMKERSVVSWTSLMTGYALEGLSDEAIKLFHDMKMEGVQPDSFTITSILHACACSSSLGTGKIVHNYIKENDMLSSLFVCNALLDMYAKCGSMVDALSVFCQMPKKDIVSWNSMIGGYSKNSLPNEALNLFIDMQHELRPDSITMSCILPACASLSALEKGQEIHAHTLRKGFSSDQQVQNALIDMYIKCGRLALANLLFDMLPMKDLISWTVMIAGYGMHGFGTEAVTAFNEMRHAGVNPDEVSFISILYACSHSGLVDEGWKFFNIMRKEYNIEPKLEHYACMADIFSRTGNLSKAYSFIKNMSIEPDAAVWGSLLCGCRIYPDVELAEKVAEHVFELEPENTGYYVLLANIYAEAEKWEEVKNMRQRIGRQGLRKNPGCSWIEIKGKVHIFAAGSSSHPQINEIELLLNRLRMRMKEEGCFPKMRYALINAGDTEKEMALCGHSEKLAMAFGILSTPPGKTIRVTKNLRVCGDCHETAKFLSKTTGREIFLRDSNRFHHFKDGYCSCRGFW